MPAVVVVVYANCLGHAFVWDDQYLVVDNPQIKDWHRVASLFVSDLFPPVMPSGYYRPLQALSNLVDYQVWGLLPAGFHLTNIVLHAATALMFYVVAVELLRGATAALVAALLFAVHPVHTEAIAYVSGRSDPLAALFLLAAVLGFIRHGRGQRVGWLAASLACFALALLAREASVALLFLLPLVDATERRSRHEAMSPGSLAPRLLPYAAVVLAYALVRRAVIDVPSLVGPPGETPLGPRLLTMMNVLARYGALLLVPVNLHMERRVPVATSLNDPAALAGIVGLTALIATALRARTNAWTVTLGIAWFLLALIPVANVWPLATFMAEHWLYVPSMGAFLVAGWGTDWLMRQGKRHAALTAAATATMILSVGTIVRNRDWRDPLTLYQATTRSAPHSARAWTNLAHAYRDAGRVDDARVAYERALQTMALAPPAAVRRSHQQEAQEQALVGNIEQQRGHFAEAEARYRAALALDPTLASVFNNLGLTLGALGRPQEAEDAFVSAIRLYPDFAAAHSNLGNVRFRRGELQAARADYEAAIRLNPEYAEAYNNLGSVSFRLGDRERAADAYRRALQLKPGLDEARRNLAVVERAPLGPMDRP